MRVGKEPDLSRRGFSPINTGVSTNFSLNFALGHQYFGVICAILVGELQFGLWPALRFASRLPRQFAKVRVEVRLWVGSLLTTFLLGINGELTKNGNGMLLAQCNAENDVVIDSL